MKPYKIHDFEAMRLFAFSLVYLIVAQTAWIHAGRTAAKSWEGFGFMVLGAVAISLFSNYYADYKVRVYRRHLALDVAVQEMARRDDLKKELSNNRV